MKQYSFLDKSMDDFIEYYRGVCSINNLEEDRFIIWYISNLKKLINDYENSCTFLYFSKDKVEIIRSFFDVKGEGIEPKKNRLIKELGITKPRLDSIMMDFYLTLRNEIHKEIMRMRYGLTFCADSNLQVGLHALKFNYSTYFALKKMGYNTVGDLIGVCTYRLYASEHMGNRYFIDILRKVHILGYKFIDEQDKDIENLRNTDLKELVKSYGNIRKK